MGDAADVSFSPVGTGEPLLLVETLGARRGLALPSAEGYMGLLQRGRLGLMIPLDQLHIDKPMRDPPDFIWKKIWKRFVMTTTFYFIADKCNIDQNECSPAC